MPTNIRAFKRVRFDQIDDYLCLGWYASPPTPSPEGGLHYQHLYGIIMEWLCDCEPPVVKKEDYK